MKSVHKYVVTLVGGRTSSTGSQAILSPIRKMPNSRPTMTCSLSEALRRTAIQMSMVNTELELVKLAASELIRAAISAASIRPFIPTYLHTSDQIYTQNIRPFIPTDIIRANRRSYDNKALLTYTYVYTHIYTRVYTYHDQPLIPTHRYIHIIPTHV